MSGGRRFQMRKRENLLNAVSGEETRKPFERGFRNGNVETAANAVSNTETRKLL